MARTINTMISARYFRKWGLWEAVREIVANAKDADPDYEMVVTEDGFYLSTSTFPSLDNLVIIGSGTKDDETDSIGTFGEGLKGAAVTLTRGKHSFVVSSPLGTYTFGLRTGAGLSEPTLHVFIDADKTTERCEFRFSAKGVREIVGTKILPSHIEVGNTLKEGKPAPPKIYHRGLFVTELKDELSRRDWNFHDLTVNRDRDIPCIASLRAEVRSDFQETAKDADIAADILENPGIWEYDILLNSWSLRHSCGPYLAAAFYDKYGEKALLSVDAVTDSQAIAKGYRPIRFSSDDLVKHLLENGVKLASSVITMADQLIPVDAKTFEAIQPSLKDLYAVLKLLGVAAPIEVVKDIDGLMGAFYCGGIYLTESLFEEGRRLDLLRTLCHEAGHAVGGKDGTTEFENSLDLLCGKLAAYIID